MKTGESPRREAKPDSVQEPGGAMPDQGTLPHRIGPAGPEDGSP